MSKNPVKIVVVKTNFPSLYPIQVDSNHKKGSSKAQAEAEIESLQPYHEKYAETSTHFRASLWLLVPELEVEVTCPVKEMGFITKTLNPSKMTQ